MDRDRSYKALQALAKTLAFNLHEIKSCWRVLFVGGFVYVCLLFLGQFQVHRKTEQTVQRFPVYCSPPRARPPPTPTSSTRAVIDYNRWTYIERELSPRVHSLHQGCSWCHTSYGSGPMYDGMYPPLWYHTGYFHCSKIPLCYWSILSRAMSCDLSFQNSETY